MICTKYEQTNSAILFPMDMYFFFFIICASRTNTLGENN